MPSMRALKDALKGKQKRLERAEALLRQNISHLAQAADSWYTHGYIACHDEAVALAKKIAIFLQTPIDGADK